MTTQDLRDAKHQKFQLCFSGFTQAEALEILGRAIGNERYLEKRLDNLSIEIEAMRVQRAAAETRYDVPALHEYFELSRRIYELEESADLIAQTRKNEREGVGFLEEAFRVEAEFRRWGYDSIFAQPPPRKARAKTRKRR